MEGCDEGSLRMLAFAVMALALIKSNSRKSRALGNDRGSNL